MSLNIAIIGSGISGLGAAYLLNQNHNITVYEQNNYIGGHSRTITANNIPIDTGFIVFNYRNYPLLTGLFNHLNVPVAKSNMSFAASIKNNWLEYGTDSLKSIIAQKRNLLKPQFIKMAADIFKFNKQSLKYIDADPSITLGQCLKDLKMGEWFKNYFILAMGGAIWSTPLKQMLEFPVSSFIRFFSNHGLLTINDQPQWYTVKGGSKEYIKLLTAGFADKIKLNCGVTKVTRVNNGVEITDKQDNTIKYDQVIFACHSDQAIKMLSNPTKAEQKIIGAIKYQPNRVVLHSDTSFMPKAKAAWASWVYLSQEALDTNDEVSLSYWMNKLQPLSTTENYIVTLNPAREPQNIHNEGILHHPVFDSAAINAQSKLHTINGIDKIWYAGAWVKFGFHEDGFASGVHVAKKLGATIPWE